MRHQEVIVIQRRAVEITLSGCLEIIATPDDDDDDEDEHTKPVACIGSSFDCGANPRCAGITDEWQAMFVQDSFKDFTLSYSANNNNNDHRQSSSLSLEITSWQVARAADHDCPTFEVEFRPESSASSSSSSSQQVQIKITPTAGIIKPFGADVTHYLGNLPLPSIPRSATTPTMTWYVKSSTLFKWSKITTLSTFAILEGNRIMCVHDADIVVDVKGFTLSVDFFMRPPVRQLLIAWPTLSPPQTAMAPPLVTVVTLTHSQTGTLVDSLYHSYPKLPLRPLEIHGSLCMDRFTLSVAMMTVGGSLVASSNHTFKPQQWCPVDHRHVSSREQLKCFCDWPLGKRYLPSSVVATDDDNTFSKNQLQYEISHHLDTYGTDGPSRAVIVINIYSPNENALRALQIDNVCAALSLTDETIYEEQGGELFDAVSGIGYYQQCTLRGIPQGKYYVTHGGSDGTDFDQKVFPLQVICTIHQPTIAQRIDVDGSVYLIVEDDGYDCDDMGAPNMTWSSSSSSSVLKSTNSNSEILWVDSSGEYTVTVYWQSTITTTASVIVEVADIANSAAPKQCAGLTANLTYNRLPLFASDHDAQATVVVVNQEEDDNDPYQAQDTASSPFVIWAMQLNATGEWMVMTQFPVATFPLEIATDYAVRVMRMTYATAHPTPFVQDVCCLSAGFITAAKPAWVFVNSPLSLIACDLTVVLFTVTSNVLLPIPSLGTRGGGSGGCSVDFVGKPTYDAASAMFVHKMALAFDSANVTDLTPDEVNVTLSFDMGMFGLLTTNGLGALLAERIYPAPKSYAINSVISVDKHDVGDSLFHCGYDEAAEDHRLAVALYNPTGVDMWVYNTSVPSSPAIQKVLVDIPADTTTVRIGLATGSSQVFAKACPPRYVHYTLPPFVNLDAKVLELPLIDVDDRDHEQICLGKRMFLIAVPTTSPANSFAYSTRGDSDLGSIVVPPLSRHAITINRPDPIILYVTYIGGGGGNNNNSANADEGVDTGCTAVLSADLFSGILAVTVPTVTLISSSKAQCGGTMTTTRGALILRSSDTSSTNPLQLRNRHGPLLFTGYPRVPLDGVYSFTGLATGVYTATLPYGLLNIDCTLTRNFVVDNAVDISTVINLRASTVAMTQATVCPFIPPASASSPSSSSKSSWQEYFILVFQPSFFTSFPTSTVDIWDKDARPVARNKAIKQVKMGIDGVLVDRVTQMLPSPGSYFAEILIPEDEDEIANNNNMQCSFITPAYTVVNPAFTPDSFILTVLVYPLCSGSDDGVLQILYPADLEVAATIRGCVRYDGSIATPLSASSSCARTIGIHKRGNGIFELTNAPFMAELDVDFEIAGSCVISKSFIFVPSPDSHPEIHALAYAPSCARDKQEIYAVHEFSGQPYRITKSPGFIFDWQVTSNTNQGRDDDDYLYFSVGTSTATTTGPMTISLTITYNGVCSTNGSITMQPGDWFVPPMAKIDRLSLRKTSRSLPVFCPGSDDAMLVGFLDPPIKDHAISGLSWTRHGEGDEGVLLTQPDTVVLGGLGPGTYTLTYTIISAIHELKCTATDTRTIPSKTRYNLLAHLEISRGSCPGDLSSAILDSPDEEDCEAIPEISVFKASMFSPQDRAYLPGDTGQGTSIISGVPDGTVICFAVAYPDEYVYRVAAQCPEDICIDFGQVAPPPLFINTLASPPHVWLPSWYATGNEAIGWVDNDGFVNITTPQCGSRLLDTGIRPSEAVVYYEAVPGFQLLRCAEDYPQPIQIFKVDNATRERTLVDTIPPSLFAEFAAQWHFDVVFADPLRVDDVEIVDIVCNDVPTMQLLLKISNVAQFKLSPTSECTPQDTSSSLLSCVVPRKRAVSIKIGYVSTSNGSSCMASFNTALQVQQAAAFDLARYMRVEDNGGAAIFSDYRRPLSLMTITGPPVKTGLVFENVTDTTTVILLTRQNMLANTNAASARQWGYCQFSYPLAVFTPVAGAEDPISISQILQPSCSADGAVVFTISSSNGNFTMGKYDGDNDNNNNNNATMDIPWKREEDGGVIVAANLSPGIYWIESDSVVAVFVLQLPRPIIFVAQNALLPPPPILSDSLSSSSLLNNLPSAAVAPVSIVIYLRGGVTSRDVVKAMGTLIVTDILGPQIITLVATVEFFDANTWPYIARLTLTPGYTYTFQVGCDDDGGGGGSSEQQQQSAPLSPQLREYRQQRKHSRLAKRIMTTSQYSLSLAAAAPLRAKCACTVPASTRGSRDGTVTITIAGGAPPFLIMTAAVFQTTIQRSFKVRGLEVKTHNYIVVDAAGEKALCQVAVTTETRFEIQAATITGISGCGAHTTAAVTVVFTGDMAADVILPVLVTDPAVSSCIATTTITTTTTTTTTLPYPGKWRIFACRKGVLARYEPILELHDQAADLRVKATDGEICTTNDGRVVPKIRPQLVVEHATGQISIRNRYSPTLDDIRDISQLASGRYALEVSDSRGCTVDVTISNTDTGAGVCGTCNPHDLTCLGCDGRPFSGLVVDICGVCGGNNACHSDCVLTLDESEDSHKTELLECLAMGRPVTLADGIVLSNTEIILPMQDVVLTGKQHNLKNPHLIPRLFGSTFIRARTVSLSYLEIDNEMSIYGLRAHLYLVSLNSGFLTLGFDDSCSSDDDDDDSNYDENMKVSLDQCNILTSKILVASGDEGLFGCIPSQQQQQQQSVFSTMDRRRGQRDDGNANDIRPRQSEKGREKEKNKHHHHNGKVIIDVSHTGIDGLSFGGEGNYSFGILNSTLHRLVLFGAVPAQDVAVDKDSDVRVVDITALEYTHNDTAARRAVICILFKQIPSVHSVIDVGITYVRQDYDCSSFEFSADGKYVGDDWTTHDTTVVVDVLVTLFAIIGFIFILTQWK